MALTSGARLGPYEIVSPLGAGGMGEVYRATDTRLDRVVALKVLADRTAASPQALERFQREARAASALNHPNICTIYDVGTDPPFIAMELLEGETLEQRLRRGVMEIPAVIDIALGVADALNAAHNKGIVHRDIKPANIYLTAHGPKLLDFGLAKAAAPAEIGTADVSHETEAVLTEAGDAVGTVSYMSPEQVRAMPLDRRTDLFSCGVVLYEMTTGTRPFRGDSRGTIADAILNRAPTAAVRLNPDVPAELELLIEKCLEKDRTIRAQHASEIRTDLQRLKRKVESGRVTAVAPAPAVRPNQAARRMLPAVAAAAAAILAGGAYYFSADRVPTLTEKDTIVIADFENRTGDPVFDDTLRQGLFVELQQSPFLSLISDRQIQQQLTLMGQSKEARLTADVAQQICERTASAMILEGSIATLGSQFVLGVRARHCNTGDVLDQQQIQVTRREDVLNALSEIVGKLRTRLGESRATVERHSMPLADATTPSLEALKAYSTGMKVNVSSGTAAAIPFYQRAVEIDPNFAIAYASLGLAHSTAGESVLAAGNTTKAWQLRDRVSDRERFFIDFTYDRQVTGNLERAYQTLELWLETYPRGPQPNPHGLLGGLSTHGTGRFERAIEISRPLIEEDPDFLYGYANLASAYYFLGRFDEAESVLRRAAERKLEDPGLLMIGYSIALLKGDTERMDRTVASANGTRGAEHPLANMEALALARSGRLKLARQSSSRAINLARQEGAREAAAGYQAARAVWEAVCGNAAEAQTIAADALALSNGRDVHYAAGLALALSGDVSRSEALADDLETRFPDDTFVKFTYVPVLRALSALKRGNPADSVERLQAAVPYELAVNGVTFQFYLGGLHSAYVRGEALMAANRYTEAVAEFQKIVIHRGIVGLDPIGALAHLQLGRAFALSGDHNKAKAAYQNFFTLWQDADAEIPNLGHAKSEYAKLP